MHDKSLASQIWFGILGWLLAIALTLSPVSSFAQDDLAKVKEYQVKALFLYNFANFVEWPDDAFPLPSSPLRMCLYGAVPFGEFLDVVNGVTIRDRVLDVIRTTDREKIHSGCHILFVGIDHHGELEQMLGRALRVRTQIEHVRVAVAGADARDDCGAIDALDRMPRFRVSGASARETLLNEQIACKGYAYEFGIDKPVPEQCPECGYLGAEMKSNKTRGEFRKCVKCGNEWDIARQEPEEAVAV